MCVCVRQPPCKGVYHASDAWYIYIYIFPLAKALLWQAYKILNPMQNF